MSVSVTAAVRERPILFSAPMVNAFLREVDPKTQTRRIIKRPLRCPGWTEYVYFGPSKNDPTCVSKAIECGPDYPDGKDDQVRCPYGAVGDRLWVRETTIIAPKRWNDGGGCTHADADGDARIVQYLATHPNREAADDYNLKTTPSIFMPRWASRITLEITDIRVQRLQDITPEDAKAEGAPYYVGGHGPVSESELRIEPGYWHGIEGYRQGFEHLWGEINGWQHEPKARCPWQTNPWVWAISFRRITP